MNDAVGERSLAGPGLDDPSVAIFTPFIDRLRGDVDAALKKLFGLGASAQVGWIQRPDRKRSKGGPLQVDLALNHRLKLSFDLSERQVDEDSWLPGDKLQLGYRAMADGQDPTKGGVGKVTAKLAANFSRREGKVADELFAALAELRRYDDIEDWMFRQLSSSEGGLFGTLRLGFKCNQDCSFCWQNRTWPEPPTEAYFTWLDEMAAEGVTSLNITGGEPTVHKALPEIVERAAKEHGMRVELETNAIQFRRAGFAQRLHELGLSKLFVSFHSADPDVSDAMTRAKGTHKNTVKGVHAALDAGLSITLNCVVERANFEGLPQHAATVAREFVEQHKDNPVGHVTYTHPCSSYDREAWDKAVVPLDEVSPYVVEAARTLIEAGVRVDVMGTCGFVPCVFHAAPELIRSLPREAVNQAARDGRSFADVCEGCAAKRHCLGLRNEYIEWYGTKGVKPFAEDPDPPSYMSEEGATAAQRI